MESVFTKTEPTKTVAHPAWSTGLGWGKHDDLVSPVLPALILFAITAVLYAPALHNGFVNYDDPGYVTGNAHVLRGISWSTVKWALTTTAEANWHPLTWISHMMDVQMFGTNPVGHHLTSVVLHGLNVVLLFLILRGATGYTWRSAMAAALFAVHPLNVECVAWVSERKSLLSMLFLLLAFGAYQRYAAKRTAGRYALVFACFAFALGSKPMAVTFPVLLLLWDYWPLERFSNGRDNSLRSMTGLAAEKIPFFVLSIASAWITIYAQRRGGALGSTELLPLGVRIENAVYAYAAYLGKGFWPLRLAVFYPHPESSLSAVKVVGSAILLASCTALAWRYRRKQRYVLVGWLWFLAAMTPMIGIVQVGRQAMADRYAYLPFAGLFIIAVWGSAELMERLHFSQFARAAVALAPLLTYFSISFLQISYWHDSYRLFAHALEVTSRNGVAEANMGAALVGLGRPDLALPHFEAAAEYTPQLSTAHYNLGVLQQQQGRMETAEKEYRLALQYSADATEIAQIHNNLGFLLLNRNNLDGAANEFTAALQLNPEKQNSLLGRGIVEFRERELDAAARDLERSSQIAASASAELWLGKVLEEKGEKEGAIAAYEAALRLAPDSSEAQSHLTALEGKH